MIMRWNSLSLAVLTWFSATMSRSLGFLATRWRHVPVAPITHYVMWVSPFINNQTPVTYQLNGATSVSPGETTEISPAKIADLQICELIDDYTIKGLSFGVVCYKQT